VTRLLALNFLPGCGSPEVARHETDQHAESRLVECTISEVSLVEAQSRAPIVKQGIVLPETAVVVLMGAIGCAGNQMHMLQHWSRQTRIPVLTIYTGDIMSRAAASHESLVLRRVSQAAIPFLVSADYSLSPRAMGASASQAVRIEFGMIT